MNQATPAVRDLARRLLAQEANGDESLGAAVSAALTVFDKLRSYLTRLVGVSGFRALLARAVGISRIETYWLETVRVQADATLEGFREAAMLQPAEMVLEGSTTLLAQLVGLLVTLIGPDLTMRLMQDVWRDVRLDDGNLSAEEKPA